MEKQVVKLQDALPALNQTSSRSTGDSLEKVQCYMINGAELMGEFRNEFVEEEGNVVRFDWTTGIALVNLVWSKIKEAFAECDGKKLEIKLPETFWGRLLSAALTGVGLRL